jgi:hypothetical protein
MKRNILWLIFAVVLVVGAGVWMPRLFRGLPTENQRLKQQVFFRCESCGHAFGLTPPELGAMWKDVTPTPNTQGKATCSKCRKPFCAFRIDEADFRKVDMSPVTITKPTASDRFVPPAR